MGFTPVRWAVLAVMLSAASACEKGTGAIGGLNRSPAAVTDAPRAAVGAGPVAAAADVEAPDVFKAEEAGLWDGRPSLGGIWVAVPDVKDPERVIIRNSANGKSVVGALFRRERDNPGPRIQVSSDAASALDLLAGQPADLTVIALRREEPQAPAPADLAAQTPAEATSSGSDVATGTLAATAGAAAPAVDGAAPADAEGSPATEIAAASSPRPAARPVKPAGVAEEAPAPIAASDSSAAVSAADPAAAGVRKGLRGKPRLEASDDLAPGASDTLVVPDVGTTAITTLAATPPAAPAAAPSKLAKPFIQIGIFSSEQSAAKVADQVRAASVPVTVAPGESDGKPVWRVIAGPAATSEDRAVYLSRIKGTGYADAYFVTN